MPCIKLKLIFISGKMFSSSTIQFQRAGAYITFLQYKSCSCSRFSTNPNLTQHGDLVNSCLTEAEHLQICKNTSTPRKFYKRNRCSYGQFSSCEHSAAATRPGCKASAESCASRDKSSSSHSRAVQGCEGMPRPPRARTRLRRHS